FPGPAYRACPDRTSHRGSRAAESDVARLPRITHRGFYGPHDARCSRDGASDGVSLHEKNYQYRGLKNMALAIAIGLFLVVTSVITLFGYWRYVRAGRLYEQISLGQASGPASQDAPHSAFYSVIQMAEKIGRKLPPSPRKASAMQ